MLVMLCISVVTAKGQTPEMFLANSKYAETLRVGVGLADKLSETSPYTDLHFKLYTSTYHKLRLAFPSAEFKRATQKRFAGLADMIIVKPTEYLIVIDMKSPSYESEKLKGFLVIDLYDLVTGEIIFSDYSNVKEYKSTMECAEIIAKMVSVNMEKHFPITKVVQVEESDGDEAKLVSSVDKDYKLFGSPTDRIDVHIITATIDSDGRNIYQFNKIGSIEYESKDAKAKKVYFKVNRGDKEILEAHSKGEKLFVLKNKIEL